MFQFGTIKFRRTFKNYFGQFVWIEKKEQKVTIIVAFHFMKRRLKMMQYNWSLLITPIKRHGSDCAKTCLINRDDLHSGGTYIPQLMKIVRNEVQSDI